MEDVLLIGVDGGATEVKAHAAACDNLQRPTAFTLHREAAARVYPRLPEFTPLPVAEQIQQRESGRLQLTPQEMAQGGLWIAAAAEAVIEVARACSARRILVGMGMPGLKTPDARGISAINNGPRMPQFLDELERNVAAAGIELAAPVAALGSDADYCGLGEEYAADGLFRGVQHAYYCGGGTGIADAMKLRGTLIPFDQAKPWLQKAWQMPSALGPTFEKLASASSINRVWAELRATRIAAEATSPDAPANSPFPERAATAGQPVAVAWLDTVALVLAELLFERIWTIKNGRAASVQRGDAYAKLTPEHPYRGTLLDRVIIGQRVGLFYAAPEYRAVFADRLDACLVALLANCGDAELAKAVLQSADGKQFALKPRFLVASKLRAAPALGAAVAAVQALAR